MKFLILALAISVAFCTAGAGVVGTASMGTATWTNASTLAASVCTNPASILFSTLPDTAADIFLFEFLFTATASAVTALDMGFSCGATAGTGGVLFAASSVTCSTAVYASSTSRVAGVSLTAT